MRCLYWAVDFGMGSRRRPWQRRLDAALSYALDNPAAWVVVSGGQGPDEPRTEASAMAEYLVEHGLDAQRLLLEEASCSTYENFVYSKTILDQKLGKPYRIVFVTSDFHIMRSAQLAESPGAFRPRGWQPPATRFLSPCIISANIWF